MDEGNSFSTRPRLIHDRGKGGTRLLFSAVVPQSLLHGSFRKGRHRLGSHEKGGRVPPPPFSVTTVG